MQVRELHNLRAISFQIVTNLEIIMDLLFNLFNPSKVLKRNKKSHWFQVSVNKLLGD